MCIALSLIAKQIRVQQWVKNSLLFVPLIAAHRIRDGGVLFSYLFLDVLLAAFAFCLAASSGYIVNDILDRNADANHPVKRFRPIASGKISLRFAVSLCIVLLIAGLGIALLFPPMFFLILVFYYLLSTSYSIRLKRYVMLDVLLLAGLFTLRIFAGALAASIVVSPWLLSFSMFLFLSFCCIKRLAELATTSEGSSRRGYHPQDIEVLCQFASASGFMAALVLLLYSADPSVTRIYSKPEILWAISPLIVYWIGRMIILARRGSIIIDPLAFALRDYTTYVVLGIGSIMLFLAA